ncbi:sugar hydrolase [Bacteroidia bacterium]|nr:sugar hydrolase [Bacteroidia bacterium]
MNKLVRYVPIVAMCLLPLVGQAQKRPLEQVNPFIGTNGMGHTFPGACAPFGIVQLSPDTDTIPHNVGGVYQKKVYEYCAGYQYGDPTIVGFSHTHFSGTGHSDLGDILIMPTTGDLQLNPGTADKPESGYRSRFSHDTEKAQPGYYEVLLSEHGIKAQLTATERTGVHKYTFPAGKNQRIILDLNHGIYNYDGKTLWAYLRVENDTLLTGYRITNGWARTNYTYFAIALSKPIVNYGYEDKQKVAYSGFWRRFDLKHNFPEIAGHKVVSYFEFDPATPEIEVKVALSAVSTAGALKNLEAETAGRSFAEILAQTQTKWDNEFSRFEVGGTTDQSTMFYTSLYHTMINPSVYMDVDGQYRGLDHNIHQADGFANYTVFSLWDTYRALHPYFNIFYPERNADMVRSMLKHYEQSVHKALPVWSHNANENWCMIGYHAAPVLSDAYAKGAKLDAAQLLEAMVSSSNLAYYDGIKDYVALGYVPLEKSGNAASVTLEYAYDDWTIYSLAQRAGNQALADTYRKRALNYRHVLDPQVGFARGKFRNGKWKPNFDALNTSGEGFIEGNSWNYSFYVPHDVAGLMAAMGGEKQFLNKLDSLFLRDLPAQYYADNEDITKEGILGGYVHGNEPSHHIPYLYAWTSQPWETQYWTREILNRMYKNDIDGLCGNDDCGQMSAWYIFSAMGFYPVCPGSDEYVLGAPYLPELKLQLGNGKTLVVKAPKVSDKNRYVKSVKLNGKPYDKLYIRHADIMNGGEIVFEMASAPNKSRGLAADAKPYSLTRQGDWDNYFVGNVDFVDKAPETDGSKIYARIIPNPDAYIKENALQVLKTLYFSPTDSIPKLKIIHYELKDYDGISAKGGHGEHIHIVYSTRWIEKNFAGGDTAKLDYETRGVLYHELTHAYQLEPQGCGTYSDGGQYWAFIEGMADAVRVACGAFGTFDSTDRPKGGDYLKGYRTTGYFLYWLSQTKDPDFLRKFNRSTLEVVPWSFEAAFKHIFGDDAKYGIDALWREYMVDVGDV